MNYKQSNVKATVIAIALMVLFSAYDLRANVSCPEPVLVNVKKAFELIEGQSNQKSLCAYLKDNPVPITARNSRCEMMYHTAIQFSNENAITCLESKNFQIKDVRKIDEKLKVSFIEYLVNHADFKTLKKYIEKYPAVVNVKDDRGRTALMYAGWHNKNLEVINLLLQTGADVNARDKAGNTPLMYAAEANKSTGVFKSLLQAGADVNARSDKLSTPLMFAVRYDKNLEVINSLLQAGADVNARDKAGNTTLMIAVSYDKNLEVINSLLQAGADVNAINKKGYTALMYAVSNKENLEVMNRLLQVGAESNMQEIKGSPQLDLDDGSRVEVFSLIASYQKFVFLTIWCRF